MTDSDLSSTESLLHKEHVLSEDGPRKRGLRRFLPIVFHFTILCIYSALFWVAVDRVSRNEGKDLSSGLVFSKLNN